jgi:hypothetical protein
VIRRGERRGADKEGCGKVAVSTLLPEGNTDATSNRYVTYS